MYRFQAMAEVMAMLTEEGSLQPESRKYKIARKFKKSLCLNFERTDSAQVPLFNYYKIIFVELTIS